MEYSLPSNHTLDKKDSFIIHTFYILFWVLGCFGFVYQELIPPLKPLLTPINLLGDATIVLLGLITLRKRTDGLIIASFFIISFVSSCIINGLSLIQWANGSRAFFGTIFLIPLFRYIWSKPKLYQQFTRQFDKQMVAWLYIQAFCVVVQFLKYGAGDNVGGGYGDGGSGIVSFGIYFFSFYLLSKRVDKGNVYKSIYDNSWLVVLLFPTFLNETKVSFILLLMYFMLLFPINRQYLKRLLLVSPFMAILMGGAVWVYIETVDKSDEMLDPKFLLEQYLYGDYTVDEMADAVDWIMENETRTPDLPRFAKIAAVPYIIDQNGGHWLTGLGLQGFSGTVNMKASKTVEEYNWFFLGTNPYINDITVQLGILGLIWLQFCYYNMFTSRPPGFHRNKNITAFAILSFIIHFVYSDIINTLFFSIIFFIFVFRQWEPDINNTNDNRQ